MFSWLFFLFFLIPTVAAVFGDTVQHPLCDDSMDFFRLTSKPSGPLSSILCKLGKDPNFQLFLHSIVQGETCRGCGQGSAFSRSPVEGLPWNAAPSLPGVGIRWREKIQSWRMHTHEQGLASVSKLFPFGIPHNVFILCPMENTLPLRKVFTPRACTWRWMW